MLDSEYRVNWCNDAAREHLGLDAEQDRGQPILNFVREPAFVEYVRRAEFGQPVRLQPSGPQPRMLSLQIVSFGQEEHLLLSQDVTGAERLDAMRRDFVANVSHELRTPLTVLSGFIETIMDLKLDGARVRDYVSLMAPQAERMQRLIEDLLTLSALEYATAPPPGHRVAVRPLLDRIRAEAEALSAARHRISLSIDSEHDLAGSEPEIASAFLNLVTNAVRYTPKGGEIRLRWRSSAEGGEFSVEDTGIGVDSRHLPRLTERFYRVEGQKSGERLGTGLGLAIVKHIVNRHRGGLVVESAIGAGTTFTAYLPVRT